MYYLQSRYYDPNTGRFINADNYPSTGQDFTGNNMFAYCGNNPIARADYGGEFWHILVGAVVGAATQYVADVVTNLASGKSLSDSLKPSSTWADYGSAALSGALAASGVGLGVSIAANAALGGATYLVNCGINGEDANAFDFSLAVGIGGVSGLIGGSGANGAKLRGVASRSKQIIGTAMSPKKVAMYTAKLVGVREVVAVSALRTVTAGLASNALNYGRKILTHSEA